MADVAGAQVSFQPSQTIVKAHATSSEYDSHNKSEAMHIRISQDCKHCYENPLPYLMPPAPVGQVAYFHSDPTLSVTPDKVAATRRKDGHQRPKSMTTPVSMVRNVGDTSTEEQCGLGHTFASARVKEQGTETSLVTTPKKSTDFHVSRAKSSLKREGNPLAGNEKLKQRVRFHMDKQSESDFKDEIDDKMLKNGKSVLQHICLAHKQHENIHQNAVDAFVCSLEAEHGGEHDVSVKHLKPANIPTSIPFEDNKSVECFLQDSNQSKVVVAREMQEQPLLKEYEYPFEVTNAVCEEEHVFSRPEFHNSLKVYNELKAIGGAALDISTAVQNHLFQCQDIRQDIGEKAATKVNQKYSSSQYKGLVGLEASVEDLCHKTEKQMSLKVKPTRQQIRKISDGQGPDLMEFFCSDLEKEGADFHPTCLNPLLVDLSTAPDYLAFDLYKHNRIWENLLL